ncbi:amino acid ABC transporter substrate-binding protein (PAAT family) [Terracoccus luteus]|jgi:glutamate transport system substrate-binding protein|uniref:Amino acid ABC transporter substrate-binding protein (PAAT family) n=1 Tax=Terracoccus luteus TaxID=53356 RepID=A0A495XUS6_9MICO|nr:glutamate ABC transporter substrate-binding protein [Terracoccus luteus]RKT77702.1 amino acid ABC transporter substrate-binding protein (PAAT family) [Terracoccus luteus]
MNARRIGAALAGTVLALSIAACGDGSSGGGTGAGGDGAKALKIGIKFDQPGLGLKQGSTYTGMDVDVAKYIAKQLGTDEGDITWVQAPSAQRESLISTGQVDFIVATYSITDKRKESVSFAGPYFVAGQDLLVRADDSSITGPDSLNGKKLCSVKGSTSAQKVKDEFANQVQLQEFSGYSECLPALASGGVDALTTDDTILAGFAAQDANKGKFKVVGKPFSTEKYGVGLKKGNTDLCNKITDAIKKMQSDGSLEKAIEANLGPADYTPGPGNPATPEACA